ALILRVGEGRLELPRLRLAHHGGAAGLDSPPWQRTPGRGVEEADLARDLELLALGRQDSVGHAGSLHGVARSEQPPCCEGKWWAPMRGLGPSESPWPVGAQGLINTVSAIKD